MEYPIDCVIWASGFGGCIRLKRLAGFGPGGRGGLKRSDHWAQGMRSQHGIHTRGFPNLYFVQPTQGANLISNVPHNLTEAGLTIARVVAHARSTGAQTVEVSQQAQDAWVELLLKSPGRMTRSPDCTPGYYNNEGKEPGPVELLSVGYPAGATAYCRYLQQWRDRGAFEGLEFR